MIPLWVKNFLVIGLLALNTSAFAQSESFAIECKVSGEFLGVTGSELKIKDQLIMVSVDLKPPVTVTIEGSGHLNIGIVTSKNPLVNKELISLTEDVKTNFKDTFSLVSINRITGFINIHVISNPPRSNRKLVEVTTISGFCSKVSNKAKF